MANATRVHAADNGDQVETRVLIATGGAAPLHAARIAQKLSIDKIVVPAGAGVGSAHGFLEAPIAYEAVRSQVVSLDAFDAELVNGIFDDLRKEAEAVLRLASSEQSFSERRFADMRYDGQGHDLAVEIPAKIYDPDDGAMLEERFHETYRRNFNRTIPGLRAQALTWTLVLFQDGDIEVRHKPAATARASAPQIAGRREIFDAGLGRMVEAVVIDRDCMVGGDGVAGPAVVTETQTTTYVPPGFNVTMTANGHLVLERGTDQ